MLGTESALSSFSGPFFLVAFGLLQKKRGNGLFHYFDSAIPRLIKTDISCIRILSRDDTTSLQLFDNRVECNYGSFHVLHLGKDIICLFSGIDRFGLGE
jgi:hypothetical protein